MSLPLGVTAVMLPELDFDEQIDLCVELGVSHYTFRPRQITDRQRGEAYSNWGNHKFDLTPQRLASEGAELSQRLRAAGLTPFGTVPAAAVTDDDDAIRLHLDGAAAAGAGRVRMMPPGYPLRPFDYQALLDDALRRYDRAVQLARPRGVKLVIETHAGSLAASPALAWNLVRRFDPSDVGVIFDLPNFAREGGVNPHLAVSVLRPWIDHCHVGGCQRVERGADAWGFRLVDTRMCAIAQSDLHVPTWLEALVQSGVRVPLVIEDYSPGLSGAERLRRSVAELRRIDAVGLG